jgi:hypothetical protein
MNEDIDGEADEATITTVGEYGQQEELPAARFTCSGWMQPRWQRRRSRCAISATVFTR